jgi:pyrimidine operon attenuation protein / uracil phosphoribosyltransferase
MSEKTLPPADKSLIDKSSWKKVLTEERIRRGVARISHEILERNQGPSNVAIVGIRTRGEYVADRIKKQIKELEGVEVPVGVVDITLYRDDLFHNPEQPLVRGTELPFDVDKYNIILVDDVLFTGRTIRAALDAIIDFGRPISVQLAVLVDRGHRELPIRADYIGKSLPTARNEIVEVCLCEKDGEDAVYLRQREEEKNK